jgi:hypothetical protein
MILQKVHAPCAARSSWGAESARGQAVRIAMAYFAIRYMLKYSSEVARRRLCDELERLGGIEAADMFYLIELDGTAAEVRDYLLTFLTSRDLLIVVPFDQRPEITLALAGTQSWIEDRFSTSAESKVIAETAEGGSGDPACHDEGDA